MEYETSYTLSDEQKTKVEAVVSEGKKFYGDFGNIILESEFDAGVFFEYQFDSN